MKKTQNIKIIVAISIALIVGIFIGYLATSSEKPATVADSNSVDSSIEVQEEIWTCSMHPQIRQAETGDCPICGMELIPLENGSSEGIDAGAISMTPTAMKLARVETAVVGGSDNMKTLNLNGKITVDERLAYIQSSHIPGRVEDLKINFAGEYVTKGQVIGRIYSPELVTAQEELFEARKIKDTQPALYKAAVQKLKNWKIGESTIQNIMSAEKVQESIPITAGISGYVTEMMVNLGDYIDQGQALYKIADLSSVWVKLDVYESDMQWVEKGDEVAFTVASIPGREYAGKIDFIDPIINPQTRVAKARISVSNPEKKLKPEMFVAALLKTSLTGDENISVPKSAVMWTGKRSVVYVMKQTKTATTFQMREVTLGPALGDSYIIREGLSAGEEIAVNGTFSIDAAAQLAGKPSMMSPEGDATTTGHNHGGTKLSESSQPTEKASAQTVAALNILINSYLNLKNALVKDDFTKAKDAAATLDKNIRDTSIELFKGRSHEVWVTESTTMKSALKEMNDLESARKNLEKLSEAILKVLKSSGYQGKTLYIDFCPMANNNNGAIWISEDKEIRNPYFGSSMLSCGEIHERLE